MTRRPSKAKASAKANTLAKRPSKASPAEAGITIPEDQWDLPVSFGLDGAMVTLRGAVLGGGPILSPSQLTAEQWAELTAERIKRHRTFEVGMVGAGIVDRSRAIAEVESRSRVGREL